MIRCMDFNADLGEGGDDQSLMPWLSSASIACGFHAGDPSRMRDTVALCLQHGVAIGAHPSFDDRANFGRTEHPITPADAHALVSYQIGALAGLARAAGARLAHVKPHGALYNQAARDPALADAIAAAVRDADPGLRLFGLASSALTAAGERLGLAVAHEVFAERRYDADGRLAPRGSPGAVIDTVGDSLAQVRQLLGDGAVTARSGERIALRADTLCLHGDRPDAAAFARALRKALDADGVQVRAPGRGDE
ncbi:MAG TPA: 5-oxoprolinase subunit PxpA [Arenimonas sp.]